MVNQIEVYIEKKEIYLINKKIQIILLYMVIVTTIKTFIIHNIIPKWDTKDGNRNNNLIKINIVKQVIRL